MKVSLASVIDLMYNEFRALPIIFYYVGGR